MMPEHQKFEHTKPVLTLWLVRLFGFDGMLPLIILVVPGLILFFFGRGPIFNFAAVVLPIGACVWRLILGWRQIETNRCTPQMRTFQHLIFMIALILATLLDTLVIIQWELGGGHNWGDILAMLIVYAAYLSAMAIATYPGRPMD